MSDNVVLRLRGLRKIDALELREQLPEGSATFDEAPIPDGAYGEPATITAAFVFGAYVFRAVSAYLERKNGDRPFDRVIEIEKPDGTRIVERIRRAEGESVEDALRRVLDGIPETSALLESMT
jgi:hypothetical protein